jgi:hypothetical protein
MRSSMLAVSRFVPDNAAYAPLGGAIDSNCMNNQIAASAARRGYSWQPIFIARPFRASIGVAGYREFILAAIVLIGSAFPFAGRCRAATAQAAIPTVSPAAGTYAKAQTVTLKSSTPGATVRYTIDGSAPTASSPLYKGPITVSATEKVRAVAFANNYSASGVASAAYTITPATAAPVFSVASGGYHTVQTVAISGATAGAVIYYTTDGSAPTSKSIKYTGPIKVGASTSFHAAALAPGDSLSAAVLGWYTIVLPTAVPVVSPAPGTYNKIQSVTLTDATPGATIYYTTNGSYPSTASTVYSKPILATANTVIIAVAIAPNYEGGPSVKAAYTIVAPPPAITPQSGTLQNNAKVTMSDAVAGAAIHYTSDGSAPTASSPVYSGPIAVSPQRSATIVYQAIAVASGYLPSAVETASFTVDLPAGVLAQATVGSTAARTIPPNFMGLSTDWRQPPMMMGQASTGVNESYRTLLKNLTANSTAPMLIRITGDDSAVDNIQTDIEPLVELAQAVNINYILGVDLWNGNVSLAQAEASAWMTGIPNDLIHGFEIGNEPDVYPYNSARPRNYSFAQYLVQLQQWQQAVETTGHGFATMGPSMGAETNWVPNSTSALTSGAMSPTIVSQHSYLGGQTEASGKAWPSDYLLQPIATTEFPAFYSGFAAAAHKAGHVFRMSEINSFFGGGVSGLSDTFSSSLWSIDLMFTYLNSGMDGVNWHTGQGTRYELFLFHPRTANGMTTFPLTQVAPLYYGLLVFSEVAGRDAKLLPVATATDANVSIWATVDDASATHVVIINKDERATGDVQITLPGYTSGTVRYLTAPSYSATNGVTWGGQTFDGSQDGTIQGSLATTTITDSNGVFTLRNMPITCAAVIDFSR